MHKPSIWVFCFALICTYPSYADTQVILIDKQEIVVPTFEGFKFTSDRNSAEFKKLDADFLTTEAISQGYYYEENPSSNLTRVISLLSYKSTPIYVTKKMWARGKNDLYEDSQKPFVKEGDGAKVEQNIYESITHPDLYNTYISEIKVYVKKNDKYQYILSSLDSKTYVYLNGKILIIMISFQGINAFNKNNIEWAKVISETTAQRLIELNPPTEASLKAEKEEERHFWKVIIVIIVSAGSILLKYRAKIFKK
jgi:hypothetical protein